jgi:hypothetical protein
MKLKLAASALFERVVVPARSSNTMLAIAGLFTLISGVGVSLSLAQAPALINWSYTHWAFTYDYGFVKRALIGQILASFVPPDSLYAVIERLALVSSVCASASLIFFFFRPFLRSRQPGQFVFAVLATTHFGTVQHFFYDLGRFDQLGLLLCLGCLLTIEKCRQRVTAVVILVSCCVGVLIHEAFFVIYLPLIMAYWRFRQSPDLSTLLQLAVVLPATVLLVFANGAKPQIAQVEYVQHLKDIHGPWIDEKSVQVLYGGPVSEAERTSRVLLSPMRIAHTAVLFAFLLPSLLLLAKIIRAASRPGDSLIGNRDGSILLLLAALSPLSLYMIGLDFARWWALAITNVLLAISLLMTCDNWNALVNRTLAEQRLLSWSALTLSFVAGPLGVAASPFPRIEGYVQVAIAALIHAVRG